MPEADQSVVDVAQVNEVSDKTETIEPSETTETIENTEAAEAKPGTPDKAMQKFQQEFGNVKRQLASLLKKKAAEGELSEADKAKVAKAQQRLGKIQAFVNPDAEASDPIAEQVLELTDKLSTQDQLAAENREMKARLAALENDRNWQVAKTKYAGLDVDAIWDKALTDAADTLGEDGTDRAKNRLASKLFEERCDAAKARKKEDPKPKPGSAPAPSTYKIGTAARVAPVLSEEDDALQQARSLIVEI